MGNRNQLQHPHDMKQPHTIETLTAKMHDIVRGGCTRLVRAKSVPATANFGVMHASTEGRTFCLYFTAKRAFVKHETLGTFRIIQPD